jgi:asparagine synthase (glutamine-hydrolysing)
MISDVPLGALLSGGIDSSTIVALMQRQSPRPIRTFTIGFTDAAYNEAKDAKAVARHLGTDHTELYVTPEEAQAVIPLLPEMYDEPFSDSSQLPTSVVCRLARSHVTVSLSGDGGDEVFAGYTRYALAQKIWSILGRTPAAIRNLTACIIRATPADRLDAVYRVFAPIVPERFRFSHPADKARKFSELMHATRPDDLYRRLVSLWRKPEELVVGGTEPDSALDDPAVLQSIPDFTERMMYLDLITYLPNDILVKVDRASMAASLEMRSPLLDHRIIEWSWRLPMHFKRRDGKSKWLLRQVLYKYVPPALVERPKMGFGIPIGAWLKGPLRDWAEALLDEQRLRREGFLRPEAIRKLWLEHLADHCREDHRLWCILMFQAWLERWR